VSILPKTVAGALRLIEKAEEAHADLIEVRLDSFKDYRKLAGVATHGKTLKIAACKPPRCHGTFPGTETEQQQVVLDAAKSGFTYVDVDLTQPKLNETVAELRRLGVKVIVSFHSFAETPSAAELNSVLDMEIALGADVCKIVTTANRIEDNLVLLNLTEASCSKAKLVCFAMGEQGKVSRLLSPLFGGYFTFASLAQGSETAAGQLTIQEMQSAYKLLGVK
jgi:3-dehydroquinate dehydratase type I